MNIFLNVVISQTKQTNQNRKGVNNIFQTTYIHLQNNFIKFNYWAC